MAGRRWDWHMNDTQKAVVRCLSDDDRVSISTLCHRLSRRVTLVYMNGLKRRGLVEKVSEHVWQLTRAGRMVARVARRELDRTYESVQCPTPMLEVQRRQAKTRAAQQPLPIASLVRMPPAALRAYLAQDESTDQPV